MSNAFLVDWLAGVLSSQRIAEDAMLRMADQLEHDSPDARAWEYLGKQWSVAKSHLDNVGRALDALHDEAMSQLAGKVR